LCSNKTANACAQTSRSIAAIGRISLAKR
jgi:hypothetical protein